MSVFGKESIRSLRSFLKDIRQGKPVRQTIMRRIHVKGKIVYVDETFMAPIKNRFKK